MNTVGQDPKKIKCQWAEYFNLGINKEKYSALGLTSLEVPNFHRKNLKECSEKMEFSEFQYQTPNQKQLVDQIIQYFPPVKQFK